MIEKTVRALIEARVQGVAYRAWTKKNATARGLSGWVRNLPDGRVEAVFSGASEAVDAMLRDCADGPTFARVTGIETLDRAPPDGPVFTIR